MERVFRMFHRPLTLAAPVSAVEAVEDRHIFGSQVELERSQILFDARFGRRFRNDWQILHRLRKQGEWPTTVTF